MRSPVGLAAALLAVAVVGAVALWPGPRERSAPVVRERAPQGPAIVPVADGLGAIAAGHGDLWVDDRAGERLLRLDGESGRRLGATPVRGRVAVSTGPGEVWGLQSGGSYGIGLRGPLLRIDPRTSRVRARVSLGGLLGFGVVARGRSAWIWGPRDVLRVDARTNRVEQRIRVGDAHGELRGLAFRRGELVTTAADGRLTRFDLRTGSRLGSADVPFPAPAVRAMLGRRLVISSSGTLAAVNPVTGRVAWRHRLGFRAGTVVRARGLLWVHSAARHEPGDRLTALEPRTGKVRATALLPTFGTTGMARWGGRLWLASAGGRLLGVPLGPRP